MARSPDARIAAIIAAVRRFERATRPNAPGGGMLRVTITDDARGNTRGFDRVFGGMEAVIDAFPDALRDAVPEIRLAHRAVFSTEGRAGRGAWDPLASSTIADRRRKGYPPGPILLRSGALREHVLSTPAVIAREGDGWTLTIAPTPLVAGTGKRYYRVQARGGGKSNLPPRPMVAVGPASAAKITSRISRYLRQVAAARGL
jgi:hypothetical protein